MLRPFHGFALISLGIAAACATIPSGDPAVTVTAVAQTPPVGTANEDAADDPAIWRNPADPSKSLIVGTDKKGGLYVYNLAGEERSFLAAPGMNNVDLVEIEGGRILVIASDRADLATAHLFLAMLDPATGALAPAGRIAVGPGEGYGICIAKPAGSDEVVVFSAPKNGRIYRTVLTPSVAGFAPVTGTLATVATQPEGCIADPRTGTLYIGEEVAGLWAIDMTSGEKRMVAPIDNRMLVADLEGLAIAPEGEDGGYLVASSQGDNAYAVYRLPGHEPVGRFRIAAGMFGATEETDGIELDNRDFGPDYPGGLFIAQDGINPPYAQNFKLVSWADVLEALGEPRP
ncbi:phytase [Erythrobacter aurantius]|uniref:phytase n=1 Tax=Erythrobacter aurantius TaxID=2909249 RepID=UPI00207A1508|nr:phytase [Erythrobacter aurantius]